MLGDLTYEYDKAGNRTKIGGSFARTGIPQAIASTAYNAGNQQTTFGDKTLTHDNNGNLTSIVDGNGTTLYIWNARNQLVGISGPSVNATFVYDGLGRREKKTINGNLTEFLYDGLNPVQETSGAAILANILPGLGIDEFLTRTEISSGATSSFLSDALGSSVALTDSSGVVQTEFTYEPFGKTTVTGSSNTSSYQYTGRENDGTGLYHYRARYYQPTFQRFVSEDPLDLNEVRLSLQVDPDDEETRDLYWALRYSPELLHPSQFVLNNPLSYTDPTGEIVGAIIGGCAIGAGISMGMDILGGRKIDLGDAGIACAVGAVSGVGLSGWRWLPNARGFEKAWTKNFRTGWHRLPPGNYPGAGRNLPHYHRRPGIGKHRPYQGGW